MQIDALFHPRSNTMTYVVWDPRTRDAVIVDPVLEFDPLAIAVDERSLDPLFAFVRERELTVHLTLDTHAHADHLSGCQVVKRALGASMAISRSIGQVQATFARLFDWPATFPADGSQWDVLVDDGVPLVAGSIVIQPLATPGHTPACTTFAIGDALFTGDTLFMPDFGTGRCDFPGGSAARLYDSIMRLYSWPDETRVFVGHDYGPGGRAVAWETTIGASKRKNVQITADTERGAFVSFREERDRTLPPPDLLFQSLQVNANAGLLPEPSANGLRYLRLPMNAL